jgi:hypothetical protein
MLDKDHFPVVLKNNIDSKNQLFEALYGEKNKFDYERSILTVSANLR